MTLQNLTKQRQQQTSFNTGVQLLKSGNNEDRGKAVVTSSSAPGLVPKQGSAEATAEGAAGQQQPVKKKKKKKNCVTANLGGTRYDVSK